MKFSREPVLWLALVAVIVQVGIGLLTDHVDITLLTSLTTAIGAVMQRSQVTPVSDPAPEVVNADADDFPGDTFPPRAEGF